MGLVNALDRILVEGAILAREGNHGGAPYPVAEGIGLGGLQGGGGGSRDGFFKVGDEVEDGALGGGR